MLVLQKHHITDLYVWVDDLVPKPIINLTIGGRPKLLSEAEVITLLVWSSLATKAQTLKEVYQLAQLYHANDFPKLPKYKRFVENCHAAPPSLVFILNQILQTDSPVKIMDSTRYAGSL